MTMYHAITTLSNEQRLGNKMLTVLYLSIALLYFCSSLEMVDAQENKTLDYEKFILALFRNNNTLEEFVEKEELIISHRLGIQYHAINNKFCIGYNFDKKVREQLVAGILNYSVSENELNDGFTELALSVPAINVRKSFFFSNGGLVSPISYHTRGWHSMESKFFSFRISDTTLLHPEAVRELDRFVLQMSKVLNITDDDMKLLETKKIIYVFCKDEREIETLTGFKSKGMYLPSYDYVVTTWSCHYHEILHLLINFKLRILPLYTHPLFQEGFAVAFGGRGGIAKGSLIQGGVFLASSGMIKINELFTVESFKRQDPSLTYPLSGAYINFLVQHFGISKFSELYQQYSSNDDNIPPPDIKATDLPADSLWNNYCATIQKHRDIMLNKKVGLGTNEFRDSLLVVDDVGDYYMIMVDGSVSLTPANVKKTYASKQFSEVIPALQYHQERYIIMISPAEVTIFDLYFNTSIASWSAGFSTTQNELPIQDGKYLLYVKKELFPTSLKSMAVKRVR